MADNETATLQAASIAEFARRVGEGVAAAQRALDESSLATWRAIHTDPAMQGLKEIGYLPTWYAIPSAEAEIKLFFHLETEGQTGKRRIFAVPFNAEVQSRTSLRQEGTSQLKLRIVPTPPPMSLSTGGDGR
jgi:hypothetical protein